MVLTQDPPRPRSIDPRIPESLELIVQKAMAKEPRDRYQTMSELEKALAVFEDGGRASMERVHPNAVSDAPHDLAKSSTHRAFDMAKRMFAMSTPPPGQSATLARVSRPTITVASAVLGAWLVGGTTAALAGLVRVLHDGEITLTECVLLVVGCLFAAATPVALYVLHVRKVIWPNSVRALQLASDLEAHRDGRARHLRRPLHHRAHRSHRALAQLEGPRERLVGHRALRDQRSRGDDGGRFRAARPQHAPPPLVVTATDERADLPRVQRRAAVGVPGSEHRMRVRASRRGARRAADAREAGRGWRRTAPRPDRRARRAGGIGRALPPSVNGAGPYRSAVPSHERRSACRVRSAGTSVRRWCASARTATCDSRTSAASAASRCRRRARSHARGAAMRSSSSRCSMPRMRRARAVTTRSRSTPGEDRRTHECPRCGGLFVPRDALAEILSAAEIGGARRRVRGHDARSGRTRQRSTRSATSRARCVTTR